MNKRLMDWPEFEQIITKLINKINEKFDSILCINRGGLVLGRILSDKLEIKLGVISAQTYTKGQTKPGEVEICKDISIIGDLGNKILLVDDLVDTGKTIKEIIKFLEQSHPDIQIKTAMMFKGDKSDFTPDYFVSEKTDWIVFPYEKNEFL